MYIARARWWFGGFFQLVLCAGFATVPPTAAAPDMNALETSKPNRPSQYLSATGIVEPDPSGLAPPAGAPPLALTFYERRAGIVAVAADLTARFELDRVALAASDSSLAIEFAGLARPLRQPRGEQKGPGVGNFLLGADPRAWERDVKMFGAVRYHELYPGVDLVYRGEGSRLKSDWIIAPGNSAAQIHWRYAGIKRVERVEDGSLRIETETGVLQEQAPVAYQDIDGERHPVTASFHLRDLPGGNVEIGFTVGAYNHNAPLIIDPSLAYSTYVGGTRNEAGTSMAADSTGSVYVAGYTESTNIPTSSSIQNFGGSVDAYVFRMNTTGTALVYATFIGGTGDDRAYGIDIDSTGAAYVVGSTTSTNFPLAAPLQSTVGGLRDAFILKLNPAGNALVYSTYFGGSGSDIAYAVDTDPFGQPYIAGETTSTNFPLKAAFQRANAGGYDAFTLKINMNGALVYSTYIGGSGNDGARSIGVSNNQLTPYITGYTWSTDFPVWNPAQGFNAGGEDAFLVRFNSDADALVFSTYIGGAGGAADTPELALAVALDPFNNVYVAGTTSSTNFPVYFAYQTTHGGGGQDAWLRKIDSGGTLVYSTYLGGQGIDIATAIRVDANRRAYVSGYTSSANFPLAGATQATFGGAYDAFLTGFESTGFTLVFSTVLGGSGTDIAYGVAVDSTNGDTYVVGSTTSTNFPVQAPYRFTSAGANEIFAAKLTPANIPPTAPAFLGITPNTGSGASVTFTVDVADANGSNTIDSAQFLINSHFSGQQSCHLAYVPTTNLFYLLNNNATAWLGGLPPGTNTVIANGQCSLNIKTATVTKLGNLITLTFPMTFSQTYPGTKFLYLLAVDKGGLRADWAAYGIWTSP